MPASVSDLSFEAQLLEQAPVLRAYARFICASASDADDLAQTTFERAWKARRQFKPGTSLRAWLFTIMRHSHASRVRRDWRLVEDPDDRHAKAMGSEAAQPWRVKYTDMLSGLADLDSQSRQALMLIVAGLGYEEAAQVCGCRMRTVQSRVRRARARLAQSVDLTKG